MMSAMRHRFRQGNHLFAAETQKVGSEFEVKVFRLDPVDGYFRRETQKAILRLRGEDEAALIALAMEETAAWLQREPEAL